MKLMAQVVFGGETEHDSDGAADALHDAGYEVHRMPEVHPELGHPNDDFLEVIAEGPVGAPRPTRITRAMMQKVGDLVKRSRGVCMECGPVEDGYVPFTKTFHIWTQLPPNVIPFRKPGAD